MHKMKEMDSLNKDDNDNNTTCTTTHRQEQQLQHIVRCSYLQIFFVGQWTWLKKSEKELLLLDIFFVHIQKQTNKPWH